MLLTQTKKILEAVSVEAVGKYQVGASLTASRFCQVCQNASAYFRLIPPMPGEWTVCVSGHFFKKLRPCFLEVILNLFIFAATAPHL